MEGRAGLGLPIADQDSTNALELLFEDSAERAARCRMVEFIQQRAEGILFAAPPRHRRGVKPGLKDLQCAADSRHPFGGVDPATSGCSI